MTFSKQLMLTILTLGLIGPMAFAKKPAPRTVEYVDLNRYLGKWYEIASIPKWFARGCVASTAEYSLRDDGNIRVVNQCRKKTFDGKISKVDGKAWVKDKKTNAKLKVQFQWPIRGDYWVVRLDPDYQWAVVSGPKRKSIWILNRQPHMDENLYAQILESLSADDFDVTKLHITPQP